MTLKIRLLKFFGLHPHEPICEQEVQKEIEKTNTQFRAGKIIKEDLIKRYSKMNEPVHHLN